MAQEHKYSIRDLKKDFPNDQECLSFLFDSLHSRKCSCGGVYAPLTGRRQFQCGKCRSQIAPATGTIFEKSSTPLTLWFHAIFVFSNAKSGISAKQLERELGVTYKCAWRMLSEIRKALTQNSDKLHGSVEMDSAYIGGKGNGGINNEKLGEAIAKKAVVTVAIQRGKNNRMLAEVTPNVTATIVEKFIKKNIRKGGTWILTDSSATYKRMRKKYYMDQVNHSKGEYVNGTTHVNSVETWFAHVKRCLRGTFKNVSKKHLQSYVDSFVWHYNNRSNDRDRFGALLGAVLRPVG